MPDQPTPGNDLYVGYLPVPEAHRRALQLVVPALVCLGLMIASGVALLQPDPGGGVWSSAVEEHEGVIVLAPYAMLRTATRSYLLVEQGKIGGGERAEPFVGQPVRVRGTRLEHGRLAMLELVPGESAITPTDANSRIPPVDPPSLGHRSLVGEIVDSKCELGAMKPGRGPTHRACAELCVRGGIPPVLLYTDGAGRPQRAVLTGPRGEAINEAVLEFIADPVRVEGTMILLGDIMILSVDPGAGIRRID